VGSERAWADAPRVRSQTDAGCRCGIPFNASCSTRGKSSHSTRSPMRLPCAEATSQGGCAQAQRQGRRGLAAVDSPPMRIFSMI
jgi:hypothetical protein